MSDIVAILRHDAECVSKAFDMAKEQTPSWKAADEIEQLRAENTRLLHDINAHKDALAQAEDVIAEYREP